MQVQHAVSGYNLSKQILSFDFARQFTDVQSQNTEIAHFSSKQLLPFGFVLRYCLQTLVKNNIATSITPYHNGVIEPLNVRLQAITIQ